VAPGIRRENGPYQPYYDPTIALMGGKWLAPKDTATRWTGNSYVWITENLYDKEYIAKGPPDLKNGRIIF
jgi:hypothetical protein